MNEPRDCRTPTSVYAEPVKITSGNIILVSVTASASALSSRFGAMNETSGRAKIMPISASAPQAAIIKVRKTAAKESASLFRLSDGSVPPAKEL